MGDTPPKRWWTSAEVAANVGKVPVVNAAGTGFDWVTPGGGSSYLSDVEDADSAGVLDGTEEMGIVREGEVFKTTTQDIANLGGVGYLSYTFFLNQSGSDLPVATVLNSAAPNFLNAAVTWSRIGPGNWIAESPAFVPGKTLVFGSYVNQDEPLVVIGVRMWFRDDPFYTVQLFTYIADFGPGTWNLSDDVIPSSSAQSQSPFEIRVYP